MRNVTARKVCSRDEILCDVFSDDTHRHLKLPHVCVLPLIDDVDVGAENVNAPIFLFPFLIRALLSSIKPNYTMKEFTLNVKILWYMLH